MAITIRVYKRLVDGVPTDEVSYDGSYSNPAYFSVAVVPTSGHNYAPDEDGITLYVKLESETGNKGLDLKVKAEQKDPQNNDPPETVMDGVEAWTPYDSNNGEWVECWTRYRTVSIPGQELPAGSIVPVKLRVRADAGDPIGKWEYKLHFIVYDIGT